jgi:hypothetical protein
MTTETWPAPELRERKNGLGWLALSALTDRIHIGVTAPTAAEAAEAYKRERGEWAALHAQPDPSASAVGSA